MVTSSNHLSGLLILGQHLERLDDKLEEVIQELRKLSNEIKILSTRMK